GDLLENPFHYRDARTKSSMEQVFDRVPKDQIYAATGIQFLPINTLFQLAAHLRDDPRTLQRARSLLTIPDLFHYWLTGKAVCEYTNATTTQMMNPMTRDWAHEIVRSAGLPTELLPMIVDPGTVLGSCLERTGTPVITPASHDTASAVAAIST